MSQWANTLVDEDNNTNNSREELLSIEAAAQKIEALRQQISEALQQAGEAAQTVLTPVTAAQEPVTEVVDQVIEMYNSGADIQTIASAFGENTMGVVGEAIRTELNVKKHEKKLRELASVLEAVSRVNDVNQSVNREQVIANKISLESVTNSLRSTQALNSIDQMVNVIRQDLSQRAAASQVESQRVASSQVESQRVSVQLREAHAAMKAVDVTLKTLQSQQSQIEVQTAQRVKTPVAELQAANFQNAAKLVKNTDTTNIAETAKKGQEIVTNAIAEIKFHAEKSSELANNTAIREATVRLEAINHDMQRMQQPEFLRDNAAQFNPNQPKDRVVEVDAANNAKIDQRNAEADARPVKPEITSQPKPEPLKKKPEVVALKPVKPEVLPKKIEVVKEPERKPTPVQVTPEDVIKKYNEKSPSLKPPENTQKPGICGSCGGPCAGCPMLAAAQKVEEAVTKAKVSVSRGAEMNWG